MIPARARWPVEMLTREVYTVVYLLYSAVVYACMCVSRQKRMYHYILVWVPQLDF